MNKQIKYLLGLLILLLIAAYFLSLLSGLPQYFKDDIIAFLEERFSGDISFSSVSLWPLNRLRLEDFSFVDQKGNLFMVEQLNLDYNLDFSNLDSPFKISFLEAVNAEITINEEIIKSDSGQTENFDLESSEAEGLDLANLELPEFLADIKFNIKNSKLAIKNSDYDLELNNLNLGLAADTADNYNLDISTSLTLNHLNYSDYSLSDLSGEQLELQFERKNNTANLYFNTSDLAVSPFINLLEEKNYSYQTLDIDLNSLEGLFSAKGEVQFGEQEVIDYKSEINFSELDFTAFYQQNRQRERLNFSSNDLDLVLSGPQFNLAALDNQLTIDEEALEFSLKVDQEYQYQLELSAANFDYDYDFLAPNLSSGNFSFDIKMEGKKQQLLKAEADIKTENLKSRYAEINSSHLILKFIDQKIFLEKADLELAADSKLDLQGSYDLKDSSYLLSADAEDLKISTKVISLLEENNLAAEYLSELRKIEGDSLDFILDIAGYYDQEGRISAAGDLDFAFNFAESESNVNIESRFWYTDNRLFFESLQLFTDFAYLDLLGEMNFAQEEFDLRYAARNIEAAALNNFFDLNFAFLDEIDPTINYVEGRIGDSFNNPSLSLDLSMDELGYKTYVVKDLKVRAIYEDDNLELAEARASVNQALLRAKGGIKKLSEEALLDFTIRSENLYFQDLASAAAAELPLSGQLQLNANLSGPLRDYNLDFKLDTANPVFTFDGRDFELSNLSSTIKKENGDFKIESFAFDYQNLSFMAEGLYNQSSGFDINYNLEGIELQNYLLDYPELANKISGSLKLAGTLNGQIEELKSSFQLSSEALYYDGLQMNIQENNFEYNLKNDQLAIEQFNFDFASGSYQINGQAFDFQRIPQSEINFELVEVPSREIFQKYLGVYPFAEELIWKGKTRIKTEGSNYTALVDLDAHLGQSAESSFKLKGEIGRDLDLNFEGSELPIIFRSDQYDFNLDLKSDLDLNGSISGALMTPILRLNHQLTNIEINQTAIKSITGDILVESSRRFSASETINFSQGGNLNLDGSYAFNDQQLSLTSNLSSLPLNFVLSFLGDQIFSDGQLNGNLRAEGGPNTLEFSGDLNAQGRTLEVGIWDPIRDYQVEVDFKNQSAQVQNARGRFGDGTFAITGAFNLLDLDNFWNLNLKGQELYFDYGSLTGDFDSELSFEGPLLDPLLQGELELYDFEIGIPFEWPAAEGDSEINEDAFVPRIDLELIPTNNVRVKNQNMNVLVQNGDLSLNYNHQRENSLMMEGRLRSNDGRFNYYNSRFTLNNAEVTFTPVDEGDIPNLLVNATTYAGGREIIIILNGPADNMRINFSSTPEMTEEEILNLLSSRGALGSAIIGGENIGIQQIILQELIRVVNGFLQEDIISDIESDFRTALSLDRIEIDAMQYGLEREFAIYLGKNLSKRFYLEYAAFFGEDVRDNEISFQYRINEITTLKGSYFGDDEYQITLENEIEF